jgi:hypothetical protein
VHFDLYTFAITMSSTVVDALKKSSLHAIGSGIVAAGASYFLLDRKDSKVILGYDLDEYKWDGILVALSSVTGDIIGANLLGQYIGPQLLGMSPNVQKLVIYGVPPALTGAQVAAIKMFLKSSQDTAEPGRDFLLSATSKMAVDGFVQAIL